MGLESVEIVMGWEESFGITLADEDVVVLRTPRQSTDLIATKLTVREDAQGTCLTLRAFHRLRHSIMLAAGVPRSSVRPEARLRTLVSSDRRHTWEAVRVASGISSLPGMGWFSPRTVRDLTRWTITHAAKELKRPGEPWTRSEIRSVVRAVVTDVTGFKEFEDDDDYIYDIGIG